MLKRPRSWEEIESDEDFGSLAPERKLQILDRWSSAVRDYGTATGALSRDYNVSKLDSFRSQKAQQFEALKAPPEPESSNILRRALDIPTSALGGVVTGLKGVSDAFGANNPVSQELAEYQQFYNEALSPEGKAAQRKVGEIMKEAEDGSLLEQVGAGARAFAAAPLETTSQALGTMAPTIATGVAGKALQLGARGVQVLQGAVGAAMQAGIVKSQIYDGTKNLLLESGKTEEEADQIASEAQSYGGKNLDQILLAAGLGVAGATTGVERILGGAFNKGAAASGVIRNTLKTGAVEAIPESIQAGQEQVATNIAAQREGFEVPTMRGVVSNAVMEGIAGFVGGAPAGTVEALATSEKIKEDAPLTSEALRKKSLQAVSDTQAEIIKETTAAAEEDAATLEILDDMEAKAAAEKPPVTDTDPAAPVEDRIKTAMDELQEAGRRFDRGEISNTELGQAAKKLDNLRAEKRNVARGEGDNVLQKYVDKTKVNSNDILDLLSEYSGADAQTLADVPNPEAAVAWLQRNNVGVPGNPWQGRQLTPFEDQGAGTPLFDQTPAPAAPPVAEATPPPAPKTLDQFTDEELDQEDTILQRRVENETDPVILEEVNAEIQKVTDERARRITPTPAPVTPAAVTPTPAPTTPPVAAPAPEPVVEDTPPPAPRTLDQFTEDELDQESTILERQAENEVDAVRIEEINTQIQAVTAERQRRTAPPVTPTPAAPLVAVTTPPPPPVTPAPAPSASGVTNTQKPGDTFTLTGEPAPPVPKQQQPQAPKPVVADSGDQGQLPLGSGVQDTNRDVGLTEGLRASGVNIAKPSDAAANYRKSLVDEARSARRLAPVKDIDQVVNELEGQTWVPSKFKSPVMRRQYARQLLDEARNERAAELGVGTKTVVPNSQAEAEVYDDSLSSSQVPSAKTIFGRLTKEAGVAGKKTGNFQKDAEREVKRESLRQQAREIETEANRLVAANLGIPSPETVVFTADFAGNNTLPQRATTTKDGATRLENIFVNDSDITARQLDRGMDITIPKDQRNSVVEGITYNRKTGKVTAAVSGQTIVSGPDQLQRVKKKRTKELSSSFVIPEESKERRENLITIVQEFDNETQSNYRSITRQVEGANIKLPAEFGPRVKAIALQIAGETLGKGKKITASTALKQSYRKMWERLKVRPELMQMSLDMGVDPNDDTTWIDIAETTDDTADTGRTAGGKKGEKVLVRNPRSDISRLVGRMTNTQAQNVLNATNQKLDFGEALSSAERQAFEAAREYTLLRDRVQSEGKLDKVPAKEREELTYADLQEIGGVETQLPGTELPPGAFASAESRVTGEPVEVTEAELAEAKDLIEEAVESFPAVNELIQMDIPGYTMYVRADNPRAIYVNPKGIAQVIQGVDRDAALAYIKKILNHETRHMALLRAMPVSELTAIGEGLTEAQLREAAESYYAKSEFATEEEREAALKAFMENPNVAAMEYITMLSERLQSGASIQDLGIDDMPLTLLERVVEALRAILNQLRTRMMLRAPGYEALAIGVERLEEGIRLLEQDITLGDRIAENSAEAIAARDKEYLETAQLAAKDPAREVFRPDATETTWGDVINARFKAREMQSEEVRKKFDNAPLIDNARSLYSDEFQDPEAQGLLEEDLLHRQELGEYSVVLPLTDDSGPQFIKDSSGRKTINREYVSIKIRKYFEKRYDDWLWRTPFGPGRIAPADLDGELNENQKTSAEVMLAAEFPLPFTDEGQQWAVRGRGKNNTVRDIQNRVEAAIERVSETSLKRAERILEIEQKLKELTPVETRFQTGKPVIVRSFHLTPYGELENDSFDPDRLGGNTGAPSARMAHFFAGNKETTDAYGQDEIGRSLHKGYLDLSFEERMRFREKLLERYAESDMYDKFWKGTTSARKSSIEAWIKSKDASYYAKLAKELFGPETNYSTQQVDPKLYELFVYLQNPLVVDYKGDQYREVKYAAALAEARLKGHDGVVFLNTYDPGPVDNVFALLRDHEDQIKSADLITYKRNKDGSFGDPIPLSKRFQQDFTNIYYAAEGPLGVDDNGFLRPATDAQGRRAYRVTINGIKVETTAKDPQIAARNAVFKMFDRAKQVYFEGQTYTSPKALIGAITASGRRVYKNDWGRKFAKPAIRKVADGTPILPATQSEQAELPLIFPSMANPAMRVRVGQINPEGRPKGGFWDRLKLMVRGRYSETKKRTGGVSGSGAATPIERDAIIAQQARIKGTIVKAESVVKNYRRERKKHKDFTDEQINAALGTTENPYTEAQVKELNKIKNVKAKDAKREEFRKANAATDRLVRQQALSQLPGYNPKYDGETEFHTGLAKAVEDMRIAIDEMSRALMAGDYIPADLKARVEQNLNVYVHRSYTIFDNPEWKRFMLAPQTDEHRRIQAAAARLFQKYAVAEIAQELRAEAEKAGAQMSQRDAIRLASRERERIATRAGNMLVDYLSIADDKSNNFFVTGELPGQRKLDIIKVRGQIPKEVRELWGEIQKADDNFLKTMSKMAGYMSATDTARELVRIGLEQKYMWKAGVSEGERPAGYHLIYNKGDAAPMSVSPMDDVYAPEEVGTFMRSFRDHKTMYGWARQLAFMTAQTMAMKTIGNFPQGYVRNFFGNPFIMVNGGYINPAHPAEMFKAAKKAFTLALTSSGLRNNEAIVKSVSELTSAGLIGEGVDSGLMREMTETGLGDLTWDKLYEAGAYETAVKRAARQATGATRNTFEFFARIYQGVDDFWKVFAYEMEKFYQRRTHSDWTEAQISKEAIDRVRNKVPTYSLSPELTRNIRNIPFIAPFITWTSETIRTSANNLAIAAEDIRVGKETKNPEMVKNGYRAIRGFAFALGAFPTLAMISKAMFGYDDDDEDAYREGLPEWEQNASLVFLGKAADGTGSHFNASFLDPYQSRMEGPTAFMRAMRNGDAFTDALVKGGMETLRPLLSEQLLFGAITSILRNRTAQGKPIYNEQDTAFNKTRDTMGYLALAAGPGTVVGSGRRLYLASQGTVLPTGQTYDVGNELLGMFGGQKVSSIDFRTTLNRAKNRYVSSKAEATQLFSQVFSSQGTVDLEDIGPAYENAVRAHREVQEELMRAFDNALLMGIPRKDAIQILRGSMSEQTISRDDLRAILSGKPRRWTPSEVSLDSAKEGKIPDGRARLKALRDYMRSIKGAGNQ